MSRRTQAEIRIHEERARLSSALALAESTAQSYRDQIAMLERLMGAPAEKAATTARKPRKVTVSAHQRTVGGVADAGPVLDIAAIN